MTGLISIQTAENSPFQIRLPIVLGTWGEISDAELPFSRWTCESQKLSPGTVSAFSCWRSSSISSIELTTISGRDRSTRRLISATLFGLRIQLWERPPKYTIHDKSSSASSLTSNRQFYSQGRYSAPLFLWTGTQRDLTAKAQRRREYFI